MCKCNLCNVSGFSSHHPWPQDRKQMHFDTRLIWNLYNRGPTTWTCIYWCSWMNPPKGIGCAYVYIHITHFLVLVSLQLICLFWVFEGNQYLVNGPMTFIDKVGHLEQRQLPVFFFTAAMGIDLAPWYTPWKNCARNVLPFFVKHWGLTLRPCY